MSLTKALYRALVDAARLFDSHASLRALLTIDLSESPCAPGSSSRLSHVEAFNCCLFQYLGGRHLYLPNPQRPTLLQLVREDFRQDLKHLTASERLDTAFVSLRALNDTLAESKSLELPPKTKLGTWTLDNVQLAEYDELFEVMNTKKKNTEGLRGYVARSAESGVFLVAHPLLEGIFSRSVVFVTEHKLEGSKGFIVNKVSEKSLGRTFQVPSRVMRAFKTSTVRKGGPMFSRNAKVLHGRADFGGQRVQTTNFPSASDPSLFVGVDLDAAARAIYDGTAKQTDVVFMSGESAWSPGQLDTEVKQGSWVPMKAPVSLALNAQADLWQDMMRTIGGEYAEMSAMPPLEEEE